MNWLPTPPTDSLYKFAAIHGLWFAYGIIALLTLLTIQNFEHQEFNKKQSWLFSKQEAARKFDARLKSLANGNFTENTISGISDHFPPQEEAIFLHNATALVSQDIASLSEQTKSQPASLFPLLASMQNFSVVLIVLVLLGWGLLWWGFRNWAKTQRIADELQRVDLELKRRQLKESNRLRVLRRG